MARSCCPLEVQRSAHLRTRGRDYLATNTGFRRAAQTSTTTNRRRAYIRRRLLDRGRPGDGALWAATPPMDTIWECGKGSASMLLRRHHRLLPHLLDVIDKKSDHGSRKDEAERDGSGGGEHKAEATAAVQDRDHGNRRT